MDDDDTRSKRENCVATTRRQVEVIRKRNCYYTQTNEYTHEYEEIYNIEQQQYTNFLYLQEKRPAMVSKEKVALHWQQKQMKKYPLDL